MRECPFPDCDQFVSEDIFACRKHWYALNQKERSEIWAAFRSYQANRITLEQLRKRQAAVLASWKSRQAKTDQPTLFPENS